MMEQILTGDFGIAPTNYPALLLGLLIALAGGHLLAWVYMVTHSGLSYSRSFVKAMLLMPVAVTLVMHVMTNNVITAFGMMAVFTIVRFRNMLRDTLDTVYILLVLVLGMACGSQKFTTAIIGVLVMCAAALYLWMTSFGSRHRYDLILNMHWEREHADIAELDRLLERHARKRHIASQRWGEENRGGDLSYWLVLRDPARTDELLSELRNVQGVSHVTSILAEDESEI
jgi:hypothetical protein